MSWMLSVWVSAALLALCGGQNTEGMHLASSGYHLCIRNETRTVSFLAVHMVPYTVSVPCGGWFFWKTCTVTLHKLVHQTENKTVNEQVTRCCDGYAQVGRYCALSVNRSDEFTAKPGSCPTADGFSSSSKGCVLDIDCPGWQKCCHYLCTDPTSSANYSEDGRNTLNATVTVKVDYKELMARDGGLLNHTRLLQAMVTGALQSEVSIRYLDSRPVHPYRTATSLLIDYNFTLSRHNVTSKLSRLLKHIEEVTSVTVEDIDECAHSALHHCSRLARCINTAGSYQCACLQGYTDVDPSNPGANCTGFGFTTESPLTHLPPMNVTYYTASNATQHLPSPPPPWTKPVTPTNVSSTQESPLLSTTCPPPSISNLQPANVTGTSFCVYWSSQFHPNQTYLVEIREGSKVVLSQETNQTMIEKRHLLPGVLYNVTVTPCACGSQGVALHIAIKTDAQTLEGTARPTNIQFTEDLQNTSSQAYKNLTDSFIQEIYHSLSQEMRALMDSSQLMIEIKSISMGSMVVNFTIILSFSQSQDIMNVSTALLHSLKNSSVYTVDENSTSINDFNECASGENDCHPWATCTNTFGSYTCRCPDGFTDNSPERPGRVCKAIATLETTTPAVPTAVTHATTTSTTAITTTTPSSSTSPIITTISTTTSTNPVITTTTPTTTPTTTTTPSSSTSPIITSTSTITSTLTHLPPMNVTYYTASNATQDLPSPPPPWTRPVTPTNMSSTQESPLLSTTCPPPSISNLQPANVTGTSFCVYWSSQFHPNQTYLVEIREGSKVVLSQETNQTMIEKRNLLPGVLYNVTVIPCACGSQGVALHIAIKTDAQTLEGTARLTNIQFTEDLQNTSSQAYKNLTDSFIQEIYRSLSPEMRALVDSGQVMIKIKSISMGSVVVNFTIILSSSQSQDIMNVSTALMHSLKNSSVYTVDENSTSINDFNECASGENDCHPWATCTNTFGSYTCRCPDGFTDNSPERLGRVCEAVATLETTTPAVTTAVTHATTTSTTTITTTNPSSSISPIITTTSTTTSTTPTITTTTPTTTPTTTTTPSSSTSPTITTISTITSTTPTITTTTPTTTPTTTTTPSSSTSPIITTTSTITSTTPTITTTTPTTTPTTTTTPSSNPIITTTPTTTSTTTTPTTTTTTTTPTTSTTPTTTTTPMTTSTAPTTTTTASLRSATNASILWALSVQCRVAAITVTVARDFLTSAHIQESALYLGEQDCGVNGSNATHVQLTVSWDECGTVLLHNETYCTASVTLFNNMDPYTSQSGSVEVPRRELQVPIMCTYKKSMLISADFSSMGYDMIKDAIMGSGSFQVVVQLMNGTVPLPYNYTLSPKEPVVVEVSLNVSSDQIKLIINKCWATPTPNPADTFSYTFLENSCSVNPYTKVLMNGNSTTSRVSVEIFSFISLNVIYLHCQVQICLQTGSDACVPNCLQRTAWSANTIGTGFGSSGPVLRSAEESVEEEFNTLYVVGLSCLGIGLTLFFIIGFVCLFYYQRNRIGHYNFSVKPKEENFTYLVFNT